MSVLVLTFLIPSITCSPLFAQIPFNSSDYHLTTTTEQPESPDMAVDMKALPSPSFTSSPLKNLRTFIPQSSNVPVHKTPAVRTPKYTAITVTETTAEPTFETTTVAILKTAEATSTKTQNNSEQTFEATPLSNLEMVTTSIHQTSEVTQPQTSFYTSQHGSTPIPKQAPEIFTTSSASQTGKSTTKGTAEDSISLASKSDPTEILTVNTPSIIPESAQTTLSKPSSDDRKFSPTVGPATTSGMPITSPRILGFGIVIIIIIAMLVFICGIIFMSILFNKRKKRRSENFNSSFRNGGSSKSKRKKDTDGDAWFGPVAFKGEEELEAGEGGAKEVDGKTEGEGVQVVLSTFRAKEEEKDGVNGGCVGAKEDMKKDEEVPLLVTDEDVEKMVTSSPPPSSSVTPALSETDAGEQNGSASFCLTSAV